MQLKKLHKITEADKAAYVMAIKDNKNFSSINKISLRLKRYQKISEILMQGVLS